MRQLEIALLGIGVLLLVSVAGSKVAARLGIPVLLAFLAIGMFVGSDGPVGLWFSDAALAQDLGVIALVFILFGGGMDLDWASSKRHLPKALALATVGVIVTAGIVGWLASAYLGMTIQEGLLLGSIVASTDAAAVFSAFGGRSIELNEGIEQTLEMESGSNDPAAIFLTTTLVAALMGHPTSVAAGLGHFVVEMIGGAFGGWFVGQGGVIVMRRLRLDYEGLFHGLSIAVVLVAFAGVALAGGNGFLAAYIAGVTFGSGDFRQRKGLRRFHDGLAWLMQIMLFLVLGLLVFPRQLPGVVVPGLLISAVLMFVARPIGVMLALLPFRVPFREIVFISWCGLRGAVPIVLATFPRLAGLPRANEIFNIVFFVVILSSLLQGTTIRSFALRLGLARQPEAS